MLHAVIMAGGSGTRFWPESRALRPKQLLAMSGDRTMYQATVNRLAGLTERILVATNQALVGPMAEQTPQLPPAAYLGEPCKRDTAPCIGLAALLLLRQDPSATMVVMPSDHVIQDVAAFRDAVRLAARLVDAAPQRLVTFGIRPTYAAEIFGYIERGEPLPAEESPGLGAGGPRVYRVAGFREKPKTEVAREFLASGRHYWNSGIFVWRARTIFDQLLAREPAMAARLETIARAYGTPQWEDVFGREFAAIAGKSIDFAVMEHADDVAVIEATFDWDDVGSWQATARLQGAAGEQNTVRGRHLGIDTKGCIIRTDDRHLVATLGLVDCIVVHTPDATLVANKHDEEAIRKLVELMKAQGYNEYL